MPVPDIAAAADVLVAAGYRVVRLAEPPALLGTLARHGWTAGVWIAPSQRLVWLARGRHTVFRSAGRPVDHTWQRFSVSGATRRALALARELDSKPAADREGENTWDGRPRTT